MKRCLDQQRIIAAVAALPAADRIAGERRLGFFRKAPPIGEDPAELHHRLALDRVGDLRRDQEFEAAAVADHHARHAGWNAGGHRVVALSAVGLVFDAFFQHLLILGRQRRLLSEAKRPVRIEGAGALAQPLAFPIGILFGARSCCAEDHKQGAHSTKFSAAHDSPHTVRKSRRVILSRS
jgi:hypothetical protein